jgi:N,N'-diacetyllegionaminate synthase
MRPINVGSKTIGPGHPCFIAAEIGINHNGDIALARRMIEAAAETGADAVKFQNYQTADFLADDSLTHTYENQGRQLSNRRNRSLPCSGAASFVLVSSQS